MSSGTAESGEPDELWVAGLHGALRSAGVDLSPRELSDALWLALHGPPSRSAAAVPERGAMPPPGILPQPEQPDGDAAEAAPRRGRRPVYAFTGDGDGGAPGSPVRVPGVRGLRHPLGVVRGLRALKRRVPSAHRYELDESATVGAIAESGVLDVVLRPAADRWLHLVLAVDDGLSMRVWRDTVDELADALRGSGIFRSVRVSPLGAPVRFVGDRTAVLVVTDGVADHWYTGTAHRRLATLARSAPTAVLHVFPLRLWGETALTAEPMIVRTTGPAPSNSRLSAHDPWLPALFGPRPGLPVPVLELDEASLRPWAELIASHGGVAAMRVIDAESPPDAVPFDDAVTGEPQTAAERVQVFQAMASPHAYELAGHLAAVDPLTLPVMRLIQAAALPDSSPVCLAEVLLSGLMHVDGALEGQDVFAFAPDVRAVLRTVIKASSAQRTADAVSDFITPRLGRTPDFPAIIADRSGTLSLPRGGAPLAELETERAGQAYSRREHLLRLTDALSTLDCLADAQGRLQFAALLGDLLGRSIDLRGIRLHEDITVLSRAALDTAGGERALLDVARALDGAAVTAELERLLAPTDDGASGLERISPSKDDSSASALAETSERDLPRAEQRMTDDGDATAPRGDPARVHALIVGIERYDAGPTWDLIGPARDAVRFHRLLRGAGVPEANLRLHLSPLPPHVPDVQYEPADRATLRRVLVRELASAQGDVLWVWWGGHGVTDRAGRQRLFCADATTADKVGIDLDSALERYAGDAVPGLTQQLWIVDASANSEDDLNFQQPLAPDALPVGRRTLTHRQSLLRAAGAGQAAMNDLAQATGLFSDVMLDLLADQAAVLPGLPDPQDLFAAVKARFANLRDADRTRQHPEIRLRSSYGSEASAPSSVRPVAPLQRAVEALLAYPLFADIAERQTVISMLDPSVTATLPRHTKARTDVIGIVNGIARNRPEALEDLYDAVVSVDDDPEREMTLRRALDDLMTAANRSRRPGTV
ncbi:hypothetical protein STAFG_0230 [Streptomyces afghaniensis 772]|uniref:Effector-associated domain-containing protein n=1 Tax=Streptomyces afghaniensis 772 TaxID=1283301 RepID=S4N436_9ACTN|nr:SAV_2336 N-terminal domain-related protein [Streptomyces afghaniensis]EPJ42712.1 hypothetical protein STAFG_0230 [Streptomyces afghaniensis 772]